jgi:hypothetical protein
MHNSRKAAIGRKPGLAINPMAHRITPAQPNPVSGRGVASLSEREKLARAPKRCDPDQAERAA